MYSKLESLRGIAACLVVLYHSSYYYSDKSIDFIANAFLFVDFFFILSGFVMSFAYTDKIDKGLSTGVFLAIRLGRIYPLHLFMLLVFVAYVGLKSYLYSIGFGGEQEFDKNNLISFITNALLIHSMGVHDYLTWNYPSWSISVEFFTYLIFFLFLKSIDKKKGLLVPVIISVTSYCILITMKNDMDITTDLGIVRCVGAFYLGVILFRIKPRINDQKLNTNLLEVLAVLFVILAVNFSHLGWLYSILTIVSFFIAMHVFSNSQNGFIGNILHGKFMRSIGVWSYSIYMVHAFVLTFMGSFVHYIIRINPESITGIYSILLNIIILALTILVSRFTYIFIEDKYRKVVKDKIYNHRNMKNHLNYEGVEK